MCSLIWWPLFSTGPTPLDALPLASSLTGLQLPKIGENTTSGQKGTTQTGDGKGDKAGASQTGEGKDDKATTLASGNTDAPASFTLGEGLPPVPGKLVQKIQRGDYVDMAELLRDNMELERRKASRESTLALGIQPSRREVPDLISWVQCFGVYAAVVTAKHPDRILQLLAYQTMVVREARRCGGRGWQSYDAMFRQQAAISPSID
jgi:hypothetical protein